MRSHTVDLVVTGDQTAVVTAAVAAVQRGQRVLVVLQSANAGVAPRLRRLCKTGQTRLLVMTDADVVCVDGVNGVEVVVVRYQRTGRLVAVNTSSFRSCS